MIRKNILSILIIFSVIGLFIIESSSSVSLSYVSVGASYVNGTQCAQSSNGTYYGVWTSASKTCTLASNIDDNIEITNPDTTLDCSGAVVKYPGYINGEPVIDSNGITLDNKTNVTIRNCKITGFNAGIYDYFGAQNNYFDNIINNTQYGFYGINVIKNIYKNNTVKNGLVGVNYPINSGFSLNSAKNITLTSNYISNNYVGISVFEINNSIFANNTIVDNSNRGINLWTGYYNLFVNNTIKNNSYGILLSGISSNNNLYLNIFNNTNNAGFSGINYWNSSIDGNRWYTPTGWGYSQVCADTNFNGICDIGYNVSALYGPNITYSNNIMYNNVDFRAKADFFDSDVDGIPNLVDNCPTIINSNQSNLDATPPAWVGSPNFWPDSIGDACDEDIDGDLIMNSIDWRAGIDMRYNWSNNYNDTQLGGGAKTFGRRTNNVTDSGLYVEVNDSAGNGVKATAIWGTALSPATLISCTTNTLTQLTAIGASANISCASAEITSEYSPVPGAVSIIKEASNGRKILIPLDTGQTGYFGNEDEVENHGTGTLSYELSDQDDQAIGISGALTSNDAINIALESLNGGISINNPDMITSSVLIGQSVLFLDNAESILIAYSTSSAILTNTGNTPVSITTANKEDTILPGKSKIIKLDINKIKKEKNNKKNKSA